MSAEHEPYVTIAQEMLRRCYAEEDTVMLNQWLTEQCAFLAGRHRDDDSTLLWQDSFELYDRILEQRAAEAENPAQRKQPLWPWASWNSMIDPLEPGMLAVIGAGDGQGKTIYCETIAEHWARLGLRVVFVHYELNRALMLDRRTARHTSIDRRTLKSGLLTADQRSRYNAKRTELMRWDGMITYEHTPGWTMERTTQQLNALRAQGLCDIVVIDYLEKVAASRRQLQMFGSNTYQREADNVEQIKNFAEMTETPVLLLAQMSKAGKSSDFEGIDRTSLRGAGEKTEKANVVALLHRAKTDDGYDTTVKVLIDKNTVGRTGSFSQHMTPEYFRVDDITFSEPPV